VCLQCACQAAEDTVEAAPGVRNVHNQLRVSEQSQSRSAGPAEYTRHTRVTTTQGAPATARPQPVAAREPGGSPA
jgi:hypothetical protein